MRVRKRGGVVVGGRVLSRLSLKPSRIKGFTDGPNFKVSKLPSSPSSFFFSPFSLQTLQLPIPFSPNRHRLLQTTPYHRFSPPEKHNAQTNGSEGVQLQQEKGRGQRQQRRFQEESPTQSSQAQPNQYHLICSGL